MYKNKILGLRGRSEGLVFTKFDRTRNVINIEDLIEDLHEKSLLKKAGFC